MVIGVAVLAAAFLPLMLVPSSQKMGTAVAASALLASGALLALGTAAIFPFEMDTVVALARGRLVATHYGFYNTVVGVGILLDNLGTGVVFGIMRDAGCRSLHGCPSQRWVRDASGRSISSSDRGNSILFEVSR
ncbi:hypothetical protein [Rhodococcus opacus]|uniref:hypothetical protein n=1 Tax=Rhodococcus opacus TaxID=37919 RepID=UPI003863D814